MSLLKTKRTPAFYVPRIARTAALCAFAAFALTARAHAQTYTAITLDSLGGTISSATGINASGQIVGVSYTAGNAAYHATLWNDTTATDLGILPGAAGGQAIAINAPGQVVGASDAHATLWIGTTATSLSTSGYSFASAINASAQIAGYTISGGFYSATLWNGSTEISLAPGGSTYSTAAAINDSGQVAGRIGNHAALWNGATATDLGTLGGSYSEAYGINASGQVVGVAYTAGDAATHAVLWNGTTPTDLGTLGGIFSSAFAVNASGQVVGGSSTAAGGVGTDPFLYTGGQMLDVYSLLQNGSGITNLKVTGINDLGQISAYGDIGGATVALLLNPNTVPEPTVLALAAMGSLALFSRNTRRRRN